VLVLAVPWLAGAIGLAAGCGGGGGGGITIPQSDGTPPSLTLQAGAANGPTASVSAGGAAATMTLASKSGSLNLSATARDPESGVRTVRVTVDKTVTECFGGSCTTVNPGLASRPALESTGPARQPGDTVSESSVLLSSIDLAQEIPQTPPGAGATRTVTVRMTARALNHLGGTSLTPALTATWRE
jgi:hypothetical protein